MGGLAAVVGYNQGLLRIAVKTLQDAWGTRRQVGMDASGASACMAAVELPAVPGISASPEVAGKVHDWLRDVHEIELPVICFCGVLWVRISCQMYNSQADYDWLVEAVRVLVDKGSAVLVSAS